MDTSRIKRFATEARNLLKAGIAAKMTALGFDRKGNASEEYRPRLVQGGSIWNGQLQTESFYHQWTSLAAHIRRKGINEVYEEAAYTWFNRLCAIRILQKNGLCASVLDFADAARTPKIVDDARQGHLPTMKEDVRQRLVELLDDDTKTTEQFAVLIMAWCHANPIINACFGSAADYTELLLPNNILAEGAFLDRLNRTEFISDDDYRSPELIGWLYQFYISERKDEVYAAFKKGSKAEADDIPAATQIFTPNWIVKYLVQNTLGRIYLDNNPYGSAMSGKWRYMVEPSEATAADGVLKYDELTDLRIADLACGSGHILSECFDLLYDLYIAEGYSRREAIENIFRHNLTGIDIDLRARQLATFALLLKACQRDSGFADARVLPRVLSMPKPWDEDRDGGVKDFLHRFFCGEETRVHADELAECFRLMQDADTLGSIMKFSLSPSTRLLVEQTMAYWAGQDFVPEEFTHRMPDFQLILALTDKYHVIVMNPPYMGGSNMNATLSKYVKDNYPEGKADLFAVFMQVASEQLAERGKYGMISMHSWMFLPSFKRLRTSLLDNYRIESMLHLGPRTFDELSGEVVQNTAFVISRQATNPCGTYFRLIDGRDCADKERMFLSAATGNRIYYPDVPQEKFNNIPNRRLGYWVNDCMIEAFAEDTLGEIAAPKRTLQCGDVPAFVRFWFEPSYGCITNGTKEGLRLTSFPKKWILFSNGGDFRRWYGNIDEVIIWYDNGRLIRDTGKAIIPNERLYFNECIGYSRINGKGTGKGKGIPARFFPYNILLGDATSMLTPNTEKLYLLGFINTKVPKEIMQILNPTIAAQTGSLAEIPVKFDNKEHVNQLVSTNISLSRQDWDAHETSWDFQENELVRLSKEGEGSHSLKDLMDKYKEEWTAKFMRLHANEEELNRQFIAIYGLEDELTPDVPLDEVTILQAGEISIEEDGL